MNLIVDLKVSGHHLEYMAALYPYLDASCQLVTCSKAEPHLPSSRYVQFRHVLRDDDAREHANTIQSICDDYADLSPRLVLLDLDYLQPYLWKFRKASHVTGILFSPPNVCLDRMKRSRTRNLYRLGRKLVQLGVNLGPGFLSAAFILNDAEQCRRLNRIFVGEYFRYLPDPVSSTLPPAQARPVVPTYIILGSISQRKNVVNVCKALGVVHEGSKCILKVVGSGSPAYDAVIRASCPDNVDLVRENRFVSTTVFQKLIRESSVVIACYTNFYKSSGILGHAIAAQKPIVVSDEGLMATTVVDLDVGTICNPNSVTSLVEGLKGAANKIVSTELASDYLSSHSTDKFARALLS